MVIFRSSLLICVLLATTVTLSWAKEAESSDNIDNGSGSRTADLLTDDEELDFKVDDGNLLTTSTDDDEDQEQESSGEEPTTTATPSVYPADDEQGEGSGDEDDENTVKTNLRNNNSNRDYPEAPSSPPVQETGNGNSNSADNVGDDSTPVTKKPTDDNISTSHFLAALIAGGAVGLLFALCVIMLLAYRIRKKDEGSYALDEQKKPASPNAYQYTQGQEYYA